MEVFLLYGLVVFGIVGINLFIMHVDRQNKIAIEEAKVRAAMRLRDAQEESRRQQHERQLNELRAVGEANIKRAAETVKAKKDAEGASVRAPAVSASSFAVSSSIRVGAEKMSSVTRDALADAGVFMSEPEEHV